MPFSTVRIAKLLFCLGSARSPLNAVDFLAILLPFQMVNGDWLHGMRHARYGQLVMSDQMRALARNSVDDSSRPLRRSLPDISYRGVITHICPGRPSRGRLVVAA